MSPAARPGGRLDAAVEAAAQLLCRRPRAVALTGAGISVDSGIPDFRSPGGLWEEFDPMDYATLDAFLEDPHRVWRMLQRLEGILQRAAPNAGHVALARLEELSVLQGIVTQNIDNLHQLAGSRQVVEFHGNGSRLRCLGCGAQLDGARAPRSQGVPLCACGAVLKPDVVLFGEMIPEPAMAGALRLLEACEVLLVVGTSATVAPASLMPMMTRQQGAALVELNLAPTAVSHLCEVQVYAPASESLPRIAARVAELMGGA